MIHDGVYGFNLSRVAVSGWIGYKEAAAPPSEEMPKSEPLVN